MMKTTAAMQGTGIVVVVVHAGLRAPVMMCGGRTMKKTVQVPSNYGPVDVEILLCDNDTCKNTTQVPLAVGWFQLFHLGGAQTMSAFPDEAHLCSETCLKECIL